jgi:hypothetical protein
MTLVVAAERPSMSEEAGEGFCSSPGLHAVLHGNHAHPTATLDPPAHAFKAAALDRSATPPSAWLS